MANGRHKAWGCSGALIFAAFLAGSEVRAQDRFFGYVGIVCDHDDPLDDSRLSDYRAEVSGWTNAAHACLPADPALWADRIALVAQDFRPILSVEPLFDLTGAGPDGAVARDLWARFLAAVAASGVDPARLILHLADEPALRGLPMDRVRRAASLVRDTLPTAQVMLIEACSMSGPPPIPPEVTLWGFDCYTIADPGSDPAYLAFLQAAEWSLDEGQRIVLVLDANHTEHHQAAGLSPGDMGQVAMNYARLARDRPMVAGVIGYTWPGGIDGPHERGARDLPPAVIAAQRQAAALFLSD
jgi:hypothetical protein